MGRQAPGSAHEDTLHTYTLAHAVLGCSEDAARQLEFLRPPDQDLAGKLYGLVAPPR